MITEDDFWKGRDKEFPAEFTARVSVNGLVTRSLVNHVINAFENATGICLTKCTSGWRPLGVNEHTVNAADHSRHITAEAEDVGDTPNRDFARWTCANQALLEHLGLWCERFEWTPTWVHFQTVPPASGNRFFRPSMATALCARLPEQDQFNC